MAQLLLVIHLKPLQLCLIQAVIVNLDLFSLPRLYTMVQLLLVLHRKPSQLCLIQALLICGFLVTFVQLSLDLDLLAVSIH